MPDVGANLYHEFHIFIGHAHTLYMTVDAHAEAAWSGYCCEGLGECDAPRQDLSWTRQASFFNPTGPTVRCNYWC